MLAKWFVSRKERNRLHNFQVTMAHVSLNSRKNRLRRKGRVRARISGTVECPRLSVFRGLRSFSVQAIDDGAGRTLAMASLRDISGAANTVSSAKEVGKILAERCLKAGMNRAVFDRNGYRYHGKVKAVAEGLREGGMHI